MNKPSQDREATSRGGGTLHTLLYEQLFTVIERNYVASPLLDICITGSDRTSRLLRAISLFISLKGMPVLTFCSTIIYSVLLPTHSLITSHPPWAESTPHID